MKYIIIDKLGAKYWTNKIQEENGWLYFKVSTLKGRTQNVQLNKDSLTSITDLDEENGAGTEAEKIKS